MSRRIFLFIVVKCILLTLIKGENICLNMTSPHSKSECHELGDNEFSCCYVYIQLDEKNSTKKCYPVAKEFEFMAMFILEFDIGGGEYRPARFSCKSDPQKTCSTAHPKTLDDCSLHSSTETSCCIMTNRTGETNCILSKEIFPVITNFTYLGNTIECGDSHITFYSLFLTLFIFILILI